MNPRDQANVPAAQHYDRDLTQCDPLPPATQMWMCPNCNHLHTDLPIDIKQYRCRCGWHGDRDELLMEILNVN